ncbi:MAG: class E sortase [Candidatus Doudnabacteria bacterium]
MIIDNTSEIHRLLKLGDPSDSPHFSGVPEDLPILIDQHKPVIHAIPGRTNMANNFMAKPGLIQKIGFSLKSILIYSAIFIGAFVFFYIALNFSSMSAQLQGFFAKPQDQQILGDQLQPYNTWISGYFYAVSDRKLLDPNNDMDKDGLSNMDEFILHTNPMVADSSGSGMTDGEKVINGLNLWGSGPMSEAQKQNIPKLDMNTINNRISYNALPDNSRLVIAPNSGNIDYTKPGRLSIPRLNLTVPLIWSQDPAEFEADLTKGVIHYPGTALPGEVGTIYVSGHSSDYIWKRDPMQSIFAKINYLKPGDDVFVDVYSVDGKVYNYRYQVTGNNIYKPDDQAQFVSGSTNLLNLSTCWPIGTSTNRIVVSAVQVGL